MKGIFGCRGRVHTARNPVTDKVFVELMAGSRRMARALGRRGVTAVSFEIADSELEDVLSS